MQPVLTQYMCHRRGNRGDKHLCFFQDLTMALIKNSQERDIPANYQEHGSRAREDARLCGIWYWIQNPPTFPDLRRVEEFGGRSEALVKHIKVQTGIK
ncbi:hypothetical protein B0H19DRAFT_1117887 [Mycena capillaripes]|nr:hypothetical protein B0H19DRAFT_1117887 [Mycena capillaripes]